MKASLVLIALFMVVSMNLATAAHSACPVNQTLTCAEGKRIGKYCYGECPKGYFATDDDATPTAQEINGFFPGLPLYCWQLCHGDVSETFHTKSCGNYSAYGVLFTTPGYVSQDTLNQDGYVHKKNCEDNYPLPEGCELCDKKWVPANDCGAPACSMFCPVKCPSDMEQISEYECRRHSMKRPVVGNATCTPREALNTSDSEEEF